MNPRLEDCLSTVVPELTNRLKYYSLVIRLASTILDKKRKFRRPLAKIVYCCRASFPSQKHVDRGVSKGEVLPTDQRGDCGDQGRRY